MRKANSVILFEQIVPEFLLRASHSAWSQRHGINKTGLYPQEAHTGSARVLGEPRHVGMQGEAWGGNEKNQ